MDGFRYLPPPGEVTKATSQNVTGWYARGVAGEQVAKATLPCKRVRIQTLTSVKQHSEFLRLHTKRGGAERESGVMLLGTASRVNNLNRASAHGLAGGIPLSARLFSISRIATAT